MKRLFIESDVLDEAELRSAQRMVYHIIKDQGIKPPENVFDEIKDFAWHDGAEAWDAVKRCDEIYAQSGLVPLCGYNTYTGAPVVMDRMMELAIKENITGKSVIFLRKNKDIEWDQIDKGLLKKAFKKNKLFVLADDDRYSLVQVNIKNL